MPRKTTLLLLIAVLEVLTAVAPAVAASREKILHNFNGKDGGWPTKTLIFDASGNLYGTTYVYGAHDCGTVFELTPTASGHWKEKVLHTFHNSDGCGPNGGGLIFDAAGNLYGTAETGGAYGNGVVFELSPNTNGTWTETVLYNFCAASGCTDGSWPYSGLILDSAGSFYGLTVYGGANTSECSGFGCGTVFQLAKDANGTWTETVLYSFCSASGCSDGAEPWTGLISDATGNLYGMTTEGGRLDCQLGCGTVFRLEPDAGGSWTETVLYDLCSLPDCADGEWPLAGGLVFDTAGNLYGTTSSGGTRKSCGVVFELENGTWSETVLRRFDHDDGCNPIAGLVIDASGNLYGTTASGGRSNACGHLGCGIVYQLQPEAGAAWKEIVLHGFNARDGRWPQASLTLDGTGNLFGTTANGGGSGSGCGGSGCGVVFEIAP